MPNNTRKRNTTSVNRDLTAVKAKTAAVAVLICVSATANAGWGGRETLDDAMQCVPLATAVALKAFGVKSHNQWPAFAATAAASMVVSAGVAYTLKSTIHETRPDGSDNRSFPSGHATVAFAGATVLHNEFGHDLPWISVIGYSIATLTAVDRVVAQRHHWHDVAAGAAIGVLSTELCYFISDRIIKNNNVSVAFNGRGFDVAINLK